MDSTFVMPSLLTLINLGLGLYTLISFLKMLLQFGLPNHPAKFLCYVTSLSVVIFFGWQGLVGLGMVGPFQWLKWKTFPMVVGSLALLIQVITLVGNFSLIQQKVISRLPLIAGLLCLAFFPSAADYFIGLSLGVGMVFLSISVGKARYQKRLFFKMSLFVLIFWLLTLLNYYPVYVLAQALLFVSLFYFFIFESTFGIMSLTEQHLAKEAP
jgi:hypothetical protein